MRLVTDIPEPSPLIVEGRTWERQSPGRWICTAGEDVDCALVLKRRSVELYRDDGEELAHFAHADMSEGYTTESGMKLAAMLLDLAARDEATEH